MAGARWSAYRQSNSSRRHTSLSFACQPKAHLDFDCRRPLAISGVAITEDTMPDQATYLNQAAGCGDLRVWPKADIAFGLS